MSNSIFLAYCWSDCVNCPLTWLSKNCDVTPIINQWQYATTKLTVIANLGFALGNNNNLGAAKHTISLSKCISAYYQNIILNWPTLRMLSHPNNFYLQPSIFVSCWSKLQYVNGADRNSTHRLCQKDLIHHFLLIRSWLLV